MLTKFELQIFAPVLVLTLMLHELRLKAVSEMKDLKT
jgi:hypothetical protein